MHRSVLVVDDDPDIRSLVAMTLNIHGYATRAAANGLEALQELERETPDLVVLDMMMPVMDGREFAQIVHQRGLPVAMVIMSSTREAREWAKDIGAVGYVKKPFDLDELLDQVHRCDVAA